MHRHQVPGSHFSGQVYEEKEQSQCLYSCISCLVFSQCRELELVSWKFSDLYLFRQCLLKLFCFVFHFYCLADEMIWQPRRTSHFSYIILFKNIPGRIFLCYPIPIQSWVILETWVPPQVKENIHFLFCKCSACKSIHFFLQFIAWFFLLQ